MNLLVTGGSGFIGSHVVRQALARGMHVTNLDALTYAANPLTLRDIEDHPCYRFIHADITDGHAVQAAMADFRPDAILHCAAETHVDRSIDAPAPFLHTNLIGTQLLLEAALRYWKSGAAPRHFRVLAVSTDEVFGSIPEHRAPVTEDAPYDPSSPYAASKAAADHIARAYARTYGLPLIVTNCGNNYGPCQFPEKLIPHMILCALAEKPLPIYGDGQNLRDWIHVEDHAEALLHILDHGRDGETYLVGARAWVRNLDLVQRLCTILDGIKPRAAGSYHELLHYVADRPGHDRRYAVDPAKLEATGWRPARDFDDGLRATVQWYIDNPAWIDAAFNRGFTLKRIGQREVA